MPKRARKPRELPATATIPSAGFSRDDRIALEPPKAPADRYLQAPARRRAVPGYNGAASGHNNLELYAGRTQAAQMPLWGMLGDEDHIMPGDDWGTWRPLYVNRVQHPTRRRLLTRQEREQLYIKRIDADIQAKYYAKHHHHHQHKEHHHHQHGGHGSLSAVSAKKSSTASKHHLISREEFDVLMHPDRSQGAGTAPSSFQSSRPHSSATNATDTDFATMKIVGSEAGSRPPTTNSMLHGKRPGTSNTSRTTFTQDKEDDGSKADVQELDFGRRSYNEVEGFREIRPSRHIRLPAVRDDQVQLSLVACHNNGDLSVDFDSGKVQGAFWHHALPRRLGNTMKEEKHLKEAEVDVGQEEPEDCRQGYVADLPDHYPRRRMKTYRLMVPRVVTNKHPSANHLPDSVNAVYRDEDIRRARAEAEAEEEWNSRELSAEDLHSMSLELELKEEKAEEQKLMLSQILLANAATAEIHKAEALQSKIDAEQEELAKKALGIAFEESSKDAEAKFQAEIDAAKDAAALENMKGVLVQSDKLRKAKKLQQQAAKAEALSRTSDALGSLYAKSHEHSIDNLEEEAMQMLQEATLHQQLATKHSKGRWMQAKEHLTRAQTVHQAIVNSIPMCFTGGASKERLLGMLDDRDAVKRDEKQQRDQLRKAQVHRENTLANLRVTLEEQARKEDGEGSVVTEEDVTTHRKALHSQRNLDAAEKRFKTWEEKIVKIKDQIADCVVLWVQRRLRIRKAIRDHSLVVEEKRLQLCNVSATWLQSLWKGHLMREAANRKMDRVLNSDDDHAAWKIQTWVRKLWKQQESERLRKEADAIILEASVIKLQSVFRARRSRVKAKKVSEDKLNFVRDHLARRIQRRFRYRKAQRRVADLRKNHDQLLEHGAVTLVQSVWRRKIARRNMARTRQKLEGRKGELLHNFALRLGFLMRLRIRAQKRPICLRLIGTSTLPAPTHKHAQLSVIVSIRCDMGLGKQVGVTRSAAHNYQRDNEGEAKDISFDQDFMLAPGDHTAERAAVIFTLVCDRGEGHTLSFLGQATFPLTSRNYAGGGFRGLADDDEKDAKALELHGYNYEVLVDNKEGFGGGNGKLKPLKLRHAEHFEEHLNERLTAMAAEAAESGAESGAQVGIRQVPCVSVRYRPQSLSGTKSGFVSRSVKTNIPFRRVWRPFYCSLSDGKLHFFDDKQQAEPKDVVVLRGASPEVDPVKFTITFTPKGYKESVIILIESKNDQDLRTWAHRITNAAGGWSQDASMGSGMRRQKVDRTNKDKKLAFEQAKSGTLDEL